MDIIDLLKQSLDKENVIQNEDMSKYTSFKTGGKADIFVKVNNEEDLNKVLKISKDANIPLFILGNGSNILVTDKGIRGIVCKINIKKFELQQKNKDILLLVGARR